MSLLAVTHEPGGVLVVTDTLATRVDGTPLHFTTKCLPLPHLGMVIACTGFAHVMADWHHVLTTSMLCRDIEMLNQHAPSALAQIWEKPAEELPEDASVTVYHFGRSEGTKEYVGYAYRSTAGFTAEILEPGFRLKPHPAEPLGEPPGSLEEIIELAEAVRAHQETRPSNERVFVGGELVVTTLHEGSIASKPIHRFDDFDEVWLEMNRLLAEEDGER